jgi:hypothetical protein
VEAVCLLLLAGSALGSGQEQAQVDRSLKILYVGQPGSEREKDFVALLKKHFDVVRTGNLGAFKEADTQGFDVTLMDWDVNKSRRLKSDFTESFSRPMITLAFPGALICSQARLKLSHF